MKESIPYIGNGITYLLALMQTNPVFQTIELVLSIITSLVIIGFKIWKWWKEAHKDGKITSDEIDDLVDDIEPHIKDIKESGKDSKKGE